MDDRLFAVVLRWMENGNINRFIKTHVDANRFKLVGSCLLLTALVTDNQV